MDVLYLELLEALQAEGCAVCRLARRAGDSYLAALIYEGVTDVKLREQLRDARGLCYRHGWRVANQRGSVLGTAIIYRDVINTLVKTLETAGGAGENSAGGNVSSPTPAAPAPMHRATWRRLFGRGAGDLAQRLGATAQCPACALEADAEQRAVHLLLKHLQDEAIAAAYDRAGGLCLPHLQAALAQAHPAAGQDLARRQAAAWSRLRGELDELIRKHDYRFNAEPVLPAEADSGSRAVAAVVGEPATGDLKGNPR